MTRTDVVLVGAGPIGLEMAVALKRSGIDYLHFDSKQIGYTVSWFAPQTRFFSSNERIAIAGVPLQTADQTKSTREEYLAYLRSVAEMFDLSVHTYEPVVGIQRSEKQFVLTTRARGGERLYACKRLILATGGTDHPRRLNVPGEDLPHVSHYFQDPHAYFGQELLVIGGRNSAVEAALRCHHAGAHVSLSYRRGALDASSIKYWLLPELNGLIESGRMPAYFNTVPERITPTHVTLEGAGNAAPSSPSREIKVDFVLALIGYEADVTLLRLAGVELRGSCQTPVFDERTMETTVPGVYVAGTAVGGTQERYSVFIENCHVHVERIRAALTGAAAPPTPEPMARPES